MAGQGTNYFANHVGAPQILQGTPNYNVEMGEGINPPGDFYPAHYLPTAISENRIGGSYYVLMPGKVVAFDSNKRLIGAGLALDYADEVDTPGSATITYSAADTVAGFTNANGGIVTEGSKVAEYMVDAGLTVTDPIGIMRYSALMAPGTDPSDPSTFWRHQYDTGGARAFSRWGYIQVPIVETNTRRENVQEGAYDHQILLYPDQNGIEIFIGNVSASATRVASRAQLVMGADITQYAVIGRTYFFNSAAPADLNIRYAPKIDLPFTSLVSAGGNSTITTTVEGVSDQWGLAKYLGQLVTIDKGSNFTLTSDSTTQPCVGRILDVKAGSSKDLALVRTYYRDAGLWQEQPGSSTNGRNAILTIANAPKYIARIAIQFNVPFFTN